MRHAQHKLLPHRERPRHRVAANYSAVYLQARRRQRAAANVAPSFSPAMIAGLSLWLDAGTITSANPGDPIAQWDDQSGLANHATQSDPPRRAQWQSNVVNGRAVLRFGATSGYLTPLVLNTPCTIFAIYAFATSTFAPQRVVQGDTNWLIGPYALKHDFYDGADFTDGPATVEDEFVAQAAWQDGVESKNWVNGGFVGNTLAGGGGPGTVCLGTEGAFLEGLEGDLAEVIAYDSALDTTNLANVWAYLADKYALS